VQNERSLTPNENVKFTSHWPLGTKKKKNLGFFTKVNYSYLLVITFYFFTYYKISLIYYKPKLIVLSYIFIIDAKQKTKKILKLIGQGTIL